MVDIELGTITVGEVAELIVRFGGQGRLTCTHTG
jgi:hypothetical protein